MATTPPTEVILERLRQSRKSFDALSRTMQEAIVAAAALAVGLFLMPFLIWIAGNRFLGPYTHGDDPKGGPWALFADYVVGLAHGSAVFWAVALGPLALLVAIRAFLLLLRAPALRGD